MAYPGAQPGTQEALDEPLLSEAAGACRPFSLSRAEGNSPQAYPVPAQQRGCRAYPLLRARWVTKPERLGLIAAPPPVQQELVSCTNGTHEPPCEAEFGCDGTFPSLSVVFSNQASESKASGLVMVGAEHPTGPVAALCPSSFFRQRILPLDKKGAFSPPQPGPLSQHF